MKTPSGQTRPFAVLGHPIGHTLSPAMHNAAFHALGMDAVYLAFDVRPERLMAVLAALKDMGFVGVNLTVPHKEAALRTLSRLDDSARLLGAVNTVKFDNDGSTGFNTDGFGFLRAVEESFGGGVEGRSIFVLGAGGAGRAVALVSAQAGAKSIALADLEERRTRLVADEIRQARGGVEVEVLTKLEHHVAAAREADLVVHATPVGMKVGDAPLLPPEAFRKGQFVFDLIYHVPETAIMKSARAGGAEAVNGLGMLLHQGAKAFSIWTNVEPPIEIMRSVLEKAVYGT